MGGSCDSLLSLPARDGVPGARGSDCARPGVVGLAPHGEGFLFDDASDPQRESKLPHCL